MHILIIQTMANHIGSKPSIGNNGLSNPAIADVSSGGAGRTYDQSHADDKNKDSRLLKGTKATGQGNAKCQRQSER
ncbi:hypothetical protein ACFLV5_01910 [Chloroflexota bacterium]